MTQYLVRRIETQNIECVVNLSSVDPEAVGPFDPDNPAPTVTPQCEPGCELIEYAGAVSLTPPTPTATLRWNGGAPVWVEMATLDELKARKSAAISQACAEAITAGFPCDALGDGYTYPAKFTDQLNLAGSVLDSFMPNLAADWSTSFWCADADGLWVMRSHNADEIQQVGRCAKAAVLACMAKNEQLQAQIAVATATELNEINWPD